MSSLVGPKKKSYFRELTHTAELVPTCRLVHMADAKRTRPYFIGSSLSQYLSLPCVG